MDLFSSDNPDSFEVVLEGVDPILSPGDNNKLLQPLSAEEVKDALWKMHPTNAMRPDGLNSLFF